MIPSTSNHILVAEDWKKIYQSFQNAEFKSYDFETIRRAMINYLRSNYPEDFNDYIDSSEYVALIDLIAFLGQNLSFRIDLNARENFLETAERRDSVLRLAKLISYNPKRNIPASGLLKIVSVTTTENVVDFNGTNLANTVVKWNDPVNTNWYGQFLSVMDAAMTTDTGKPLDSAVIDGISTEQYGVNSLSSSVPVFAFSQNVGGIPMNFELTSATFNGQSYVYESAPLPGSTFNVLFRNDNKGNSSANTGFFIFFKQGSLTSANFSITNPSPNELIGVNANDINNTDVWLWQMTADGSAQQTLWTQVSAITGNNVIYNSINKDDRNIYSVLTRDNDQIDLSFADGSFGNLPKGNFKLYYRQSNGLAYTIKPEQMTNVSVQIPYISRTGQSQMLTVMMSLQYSVTNSTVTESIADIKAKAPQAYYFQNRMITAEDYNIVPLTSSNDIIKVKSVNRVSSGISKYYDLSDVSGGFSSTDIFAKDGILYRDQTDNNFEFTFSSKNDIVNVIQQQVSSIISSASLKNLYLSEYFRPDLTTYNLVWVKSTSLTNQTRGYFTTESKPVMLGAYGSYDMAFFIPGALIKFIAPSGYYFLPNGTLTTVEDDTTTSFLWSQIAMVVGDGSNGGTGNLDNGLGPVVMTGSIPNGAIPVEIIPKFETVLTSSMQAEIANIIASKRNFGLSFDETTRSWFVVADSNLNLTDPFSLASQGDNTNLNLDASWVVGFEWIGDLYKVTYRFLHYVFESEQQTAFFIDRDQNSYDFITDSVIKDSINVLSINKQPTSKLPLDTDYEWQIDGSVIEPDGYSEPKKVLVSFYDRNDDGQIDQPDAFNDIVAPETLNAQTGYKDKFVFFQYQSNGTSYSLVSNSLFQSYPTELDVSDPVDGQLYYFYDPSVDVIKRYSAANSTFTIDTSYFAKSGRSGIKFHYQHNSGNERRIDPSKSNVIDVYLLTNSYDTAYRAWLSTGIGSEPLPPTSSSLEENYASSLESVKSISDEIVYHPAKYKILFGSNADTTLQATFKAVKNPDRSLSNTDIQSRILSAINDFFKVENWDFGQTFNFGELSTYVMNVMNLDIINFVIVPKVQNSFGTLFQITCQSDEIFVSGATVNDIVVLSTLTTSDLNASNIVS